MEPDVFIYAIGREQGPIKIGISSFPYGRTFSIQTNCPFKVELIYKRVSGDRVTALYDEQIIHDVYEEKRLVGEWFDMDADTAIEAIDTQLDLAEHFREIYGDAK